MINYAVPTLVALVPLNPAPLIMGCLYPRDWT